MATHTIDEALAKFELVQGTGDGETTACVMSAISWAAGEAFTDSPQCAHRTLTKLAIGANDAPDTTSAARAEILKAGATGLMDTWWVPVEIIAMAHARPKVAEGETLPDETLVALCLRVLAAVSAWKLDKKHADLNSANLRSANLRYANLNSANLNSANLNYADLRSANLRYANMNYADLNSANLRSANLNYADLRYADLNSANLRYADLRYADLRHADLRYANMNYADLRYANMNSANLRSARNLHLAFGLTSARCDAYTLLPTGWHIDKATSLVMVDRP